MVKAFNKNDVSYTSKEQYMFFSEQPNVSRYDVQKYPIFEKLIQKHLGFFWIPEEIDVTSDIVDYKQLSKNEQHIFTKNLEYQTLLDSVQGRSVNLALLPFVSLPELETLIETWAFSETIHSRSYTHILRNILNNPSLVFDDILQNTEIMKRADSVTKYYDDLIEYGQLYSALGEGKHVINGKTIILSEREVKKRLLLCMVAINILEGIRFYVSFFCSFAFAENGKMEGNSKIIQLIARDENVHLAITQNILKKWATGQDDPIMKELFEENISKIESMYDDAINEEKEWASYLFKDGSMLGLNYSIVCEGIEYLGGKRLRAIGLKSSYTRKNPLSWTDKYLKSANTQVAPQETEITSYISGSIKHDVDEHTFNYLNDLI
jgi:ribonucleoside-diphosphate reductase beta chain